MESFDNRFTSQVDFNDRSEGTTITGQMRVTIYVTIFVVQWKWYLDYYESIIIKKK
jgi:hypothetical protein